MGSQETNTLYDSFPYGTSMGIGKDAAAHWSDGPWLGKVKEP